MKHASTHRVALFGLALAAVSAAATAQEAMTQAQVRAQLEAQGYTNVNDIEFDDGMWEADARSADGNRIDLRLDPRTGEIYPETQVSNLTEADVHAQLSVAGYRNVHDVEFDDGIWKAEADDENGRDVEIRLNPKDGRILGVEQD